MRNGNNGADRKAAGLLILVFALGIGLGIVAARLLAARATADAASRPPGTAQALLVGRLTQELDLTYDQQKQVSGILTDMQSKYNKIRQQEDPQYEQIRNLGRDHILHILTPQQRPKFEDFLQRLQKEHRNRDNQNR